MKKFCLAVLVIIFMFPAPFSSAIALAADPKAIEGETKPDDALDDDEEFDEVYEEVERAVSVHLDTSSVSAFARDLRRIYSVVLIDNYSYLSGTGGKYMMKEIERCLSLFSPGFIKKMIAHYYQEHSSFFTLELVKPSTQYYGYIDWDDDNIKICLSYNSKTEHNGVSAHVLAHELGHMVHFISEDILRKAKIKSDLKKFNGKYDYTGSRYSKAWSEKSHGTTFTRSYSMYNHYEDVSTIFEQLVREPEEMSKRLNEPRNGNLRNKVEYLRDMAYECLSDECYAIFAPLDPAEEPEDEAA